MAMGEKDRVEPRIRAMVRATMTDNHGARDICLIDLSTRGFLATTARPPKIGEYVELRIGRNMLVGQVRWSSERRFGVTMRDRVCVASLLEGGKSNAKLSASPANKRSTGAMVAVLQQSPGLISQFGERLVLLLVACAAAYAIMTFTSDGFKPVGDAMAQANDNAVG